MIYTIGYQRLTSRRLEKIVGELNASMAGHIGFELRCAERKFISLNFASRGLAVKNI